MILLSLLVGCGTDANLSETVSNVGTSPGGDDDGCPVWGCGGNSSSMDFAQFHDLNELGLPNPEGFFIKSFTKYNYQTHTWVELRADVRNGELRGSDPSTNQVLLVGYESAGTRFTIVNNNTGKQYVLEVAEVSKMQSWTAQPFSVYTYLLRWYEPAAQTTRLPQWKTVCNETGDGTMDPYHSVLFDDDRIDADAIAVRDEKHWFNIGCAGHALAKQHLTGNTRAAGALLGLTPTLAQRTAHLKMLTADYCGKGDPFTVPGIDLHWTAQHFNSVQPGDELEARWNAFGAVCVNKPRVLASPTAASQDTFPDFERELERYGCTLPPPCEGTASEMYGETVLSANY